jgi:hypothetical protein
MTMEPQVDCVQEAGVTGADVGEVDDIDMPPPHALKAAVSKAHAAAGSHRLTLA